MKSISLSIILLIVGFTVKSQTIRYFEFRQPVDSTDTSSFIVATSNTSVINDVLNDITLPIGQRRFISGNVINGNGGFNHDGTNWHSWHFITNEWQVTGFNIEYCDGISSNIGNNPSVIAGDTIYFCPWNSYPYQEVYNIGLSIEDFYSDFQIKIYPNPSTDKIYFEWLSNNPLFIDLYTVTGQHMLTTKLSKTNNKIDISQLSNGIYFIHITDNKRNRVEKIIVEH
jgi:hypothetical protein